MCMKNGILQHILIIGLLFSTAVNPGSINTQDKMGSDALYSPPIIREATAEWPDPDPETELYQENDPKDYQEDLPKKTVLNTQTQHNHHFIEVAFTGPTDIRIETQLMLDTGASFIVLPMHMMEELDISDEDMARRPLQTANGVIESFVTKLPLLEIGNEKIHDVEVAFVEDGSMGGLKLLGMSALKDYKMTIDNQNETLTLDKAE